MKKVLLLITAMATAWSATAQTDKEKAEDLAKNEFSKAKYEKKEKYGVVKEKSRAIVSTPLVADLPAYEGNYDYKDLGYKIEIRSDAQGAPMAMLSIASGPDVALKDVTIKDAYFRALKPNGDGSNDVWEGVFISKNDGGAVETGLGIKLSTLIPLTEGLKITRMFFKKVSP